MNPSDLVTEDLINYCRNFPIIVVCGYTKTGKVTIARELSKQLNRPLLESDDYIDYQNRKNSLYLFMNAVIPYTNTNTPVIVEGISCFRLLRKGIQLGNFLPDLIIKTKCNNYTISYFYENGGESHKIEKALSFNNGLNKIWNEYRKLLLENPHLKRPRYIELETTLPEFSYFP
jgi:hypothetical protein